MGEPPAIGWYLITRRDVEDQTGQVRARWDGSHFRVGNPEEAISLSDVSSWKPILEDQPVASSAPA